MIKVFIDGRGTFHEVWRGPKVLSQINQATSHKGVLRGMHYQEPAQAKIVWVPFGEILDVTINLHTREVKSYLLSSQNNRVLEVPKGFAHGYQVLSDTAVVCYAVDDAWCQVGEAGIRWDSFGFEWPLPPILSDKDRNW